MNYEKADELRSVKEEMVDEEKYGKGEDKKQVEGMHGGDRGV